MSTLTTLLGFDVGARRIGVAVGNTVSASARELGVLDVFESGPDWSRLDRWVQEWRPDGLVVQYYGSPDRALPYLERGVVPGTEPIVGDFNGDARDDILWYEAGGSGATTLWTAV